MADRSPAAAAAKNACSCFDWSPVSQKGGSCRLYNTPWHLLAYSAARQGNFSAYTRASDPAVTAPHGASDPASQALLVQPGAPELYFSEHNWARNTTTAVSVNAGAYFKMSFTGTDAAPVLRLQPNDAGSKAGVHYMNIIYSVDGWEFVELAVLSNTSQLVLAPTAPLEINVTHNLTVMIYNSKQSANRWSAPLGPGGAALIVLGVELHGDTASPRARTDLSPKRCVFFGDSITEGVASQCHPDPSCTVGGDLCSNSATKTWGRAVAAALECEYSQIGFGGLGWSVPGGGGVVPLYTPGNPAESSWNQIYAGAPRKFGSSIDYAFVLHATNDGLREKGSPASIAAVTASVTGWLGALRAAVGEHTQVFLTVPFGSFGAVQDPIGALKAGFDQYQTAATKDPQTHYIDLGPSAARGLTHFGFHSVEGCGGIHPRGGTKYSARHGELGAMIATQATRAIVTTEIAATRRK